MDILMNQGGWIDWFDNIEGRGIYNNEGMKNGMVECSVCHSKLVYPPTKTVSKAYDRYRSNVSSKQRFLNVLLVVGDCMLVGLQVKLFFFVCFVYWLIYSFTWLNLVHANFCWARFKILNFVKFSGGCLNLI